MTLYCKALCDVKLSKIEGNSRKFSHELSNSVTRYIFSSSAYDAQEVAGAGWLTPPQKINAFYAPVMNEIMIPIGILQPPFFHQQRPEVGHVVAIVILNERKEQFFRLMIFMTPKN